MRLVAGCVFAVILAIICTGTRFAYFNAQGNFQIGGMLFQWAVLLVFNIILSMIESKGARK